MKFSKQFEGQLVPEWKDAFVDYWQLKKDLKKIHLLDAHDGKSPKKGENRIDLLSNLRKLSLFKHRQREHGAIQVSFLNVFAYSCHYMLNDIAMRVFF